MRQVEQNRKDAHLKLTGVQVNVLNINNTKSCPVDSLAKRQGEEKKKRHGKEKRLLTYCDFSAREKGIVRAAKFNSESFQLWQEWDQSAWGRPSPI